jgi:hypothetical protein
VISGAEPRSKKRQAAASATAEMRNCDSFLSVPPQAEIETEFNRQKEARKKKEFVD